ncbi:MAG: SGNH/GDSL hydrolase family protein [Planctomycetota bacterium]
MRFKMILPALLALAGLAAAAEPAWVKPMRKVHAGFAGDETYIAQFGDSITVSMAFWSPLRWSDPDQYVPDDGLPKRPEGKRWRDVITGTDAKGGEFACDGGWTVQNMLQAMPAALDKTKPVAAVIMIGTNDIRGNAVPAGYKSGLEQAVNLCLAVNTIPILTTIPPRKDCEKAAEEANTIIRALAEAKKVPLVEYHNAIRERRPNDWLGTLIDADGVHPTAGATENWSAENLKKSGYALRNFVTFLAFREVYFRVIAAPAPARPAPPKAEPAAVKTEPPAKADAADWAAAMLAVAKKFTGEAGTVVPMGDSLTYANQAGRWARYGEKRTAEENAVCVWMHADKNDKTNGWWLAADDQPTGRSWTAASGATSAEYIDGGKGGLPSLAKILKAHNPQIALILLGTNDLSRGVTPAEFLKNMETIYRACLDNGTIPVAQTVAPTAWDKGKLMDQYNSGLKALAHKLKIPLIDVNAEFLARRPGDTWQNTLVSNDGAHFTSELAGGPATEENLKNCGYLLRCWLQVHKIMEIKAEVLDKK